VNPVDTNRRRLLAIAGIAPLMFAWRNPAFAADQIACHDPATLPLAQKRQRRAIGYVEPSADPRKRCGGCAFFTPVAKASGCGSCQLLSGGPVVATALCSSFAPKAGI
jgi:High potential iron-sulfur protein